MEKNQRRRHNRNQQSISLLGGVIMALERTLKMIASHNDTRLTINLNNASTTVTPQVLNEAMRKLNALTSNTYIDTYVVDTQSLNELVNIGGE